MENFKYTENDELYHYGRKGMKWGQNIFGKVKTGASRVRKKISENNAHRKEVKRANRLRSKPLSKLTDAELKERISRLNMEKQAFDLIKQTTPSVQKGTKFMSSAGEAFSQAIISASKDAVGAYVKKTLFKKLGIDDDDFGDLKKEVTKLGLEKQLKELKEDISDSNEYKNLKKKVETDELKVREKEASKKLNDDDSDFSKAKKEAEWEELQSKIYKGKTAKAAYEKNYGSQDKSSESKPAETKPETSSGAKPESKPETKPVSKPEHLGLIKDRSSYKVIKHTPVSEAANDPTTNMVSTILFDKLKDDG